MTTASRNWCWLFWLAALSIATLDLGTKAWVASALQPGAGRLLLLGVCRVYHMPEVNRGAFLALGNDWGPAANRVFAGVSLLVIVIIVLVHPRKSIRQSAWLSVGLGCILGGAAGNLHDRIRYGGVRDFVQLFLPLGPADYVPITAVFNLADTALLIGAALLLLAGGFSPTSVPPAKNESQI